MEPDIITKEEMLEVLYMAGISEETIEELDDTLSAMESLNGEPSLGYTINAVKCEACGHVHGVIHPIPMVYPCECDLCGQKACYYHKMPRRSPSELF